MYNPHIWRMHRGINMEWNETLLEDGEVADAENFLFERRMAVTRPGLTTKAVTDPITDARYARSLSISGSDPKTLIIGTTKLWRLGFMTLAMVEITGAGTTLETDGGTHQTLNAEAVNGVVLIGANTGGILRWDPAGTTYTVMSTAPYRYVSGHLSRAVAAFALDGSAGAARKFAWSSAGDETNWTTGSSGSAILADAPDDITGLFTIRNIVVIARQRGFHLAYPTGISIPAFRLESFNRLGAGFYYPGTIAYEDNFAMGVGRDDVYYTDLQEIRPVGMRIRKELIRLINSGAVYRGFMSRVNSLAPKFKYHLVPLSVASYMAGQQFPHFVYDVHEDTWSKCHYKDFASLRVWFYYDRVDNGLGIFTEQVTNVDTDGNLRYWDAGVKCESSSYVQLPTAILGGDITHDRRGEKALLHYRDLGKNTARVVLQAKGSDPATASKTASASLGTSAADESWMRQWFNLGVVGNDFTAKIETDPDSALAADALILEHQEQGKFRGPAITA